MKTKQTNYILYFCCKTQFHDNILKNKIDLNFQFLDKKYDMLFVDHIFAHLRLSSESHTFINIDSGVIYC